MTDQVSKNTSDQAAKNADNQSSTDGAYKILSEQSKENLLSSESQKMQIAAATNAMVGPILPDVTISGAENESPLIKPDPKYMSDEDGSFGHFVGDALNVAGIIKDGAWKELTEHPVELAITAAEGAAIGAVALFLAPEALAIATGAAVGYGIGQLINHMGGWMHDADVVTSPEDYTDKEMADAHQDLEGVGAGGAHLLAGTLGGLAAKPLVMAGEGLVSALTSEASASARVAVESATGATAESAAVTFGDGSAEAIAKSQDLFRSAKDNGSLESLFMRRSQFTLEKAGPEGISFKNPVGGMQTASEGEWVLTEMSPSGSTSGLKSILNDSEVLQNFKATPEQLATSNEFTGLHLDAISRTPSQMVQLEDGSWLVNSDYNVATGEPGTGFYRISEQRYNELFKPVSDYSSYIPDPNKPLLWVKDSTAAADDITAASVDATTTEVAVEGGTTVSTDAITAGDTAVGGSAEAIARNQDIFRAAQDNGSVEVVTKRPAPLTIEKVGPEGVPSTNPLDPEGTIVPQGNWLLRTLSPDGSISVRGATMDEDWVLKSFDVTPQQLAANDKFAISYTPEKIPMHMVELPNGRWLVNSDFNAATGEPGNSFYTISGKQYDTWYNPQTAPATPFVHDPSLPVISGD
ncbi:MAG: hypothetical protein JST89_17820 [Cyanobacteria bacterium SZAS-4]|nr:hypothetical protein [Cyanobacteria bacterium SZAS-4]